MSDFETIGDDGYDPEDVFDDLPVQPVIATEHVKAAVKAILRQSQLAKLPPPNLDVTPAPRDKDGVDGFAIGESDPLEKFLIGEDAKGPFSPAASERLPVLQNLYQKFLAASPTPKLVRVDNELSHAAFMDKKRAPYLALLAERLDALEKAVAAHTSDNHGARVSRLEERFDRHVSDGHGGDVDVLGEEVEQARQIAAVCGEKIPVSLPPSFRKNVTCWQDGDEILCSARLGGPDGKVRIVTTGTPFDRHLDETLGYAEAANVDPIEIQGVIHALAQVFGGASLVPQIFKASSKLLSRPEVVHGHFVGVMSPIGDASTRALMSLLHMCEGGHEAACTEAAKIRTSLGGEALIAHAQECLRKAHEWKRGGR